MSYLETIFTASAFLMISNTHLANNSFECFISEILGSESLPQATKIEERVSWYPWTINNKYYTANVSLCVVSSPFDMNTEVARSMQAFIVYFDSKTVSYQHYDHFTNSPFRACALLQLFLYFRKMVLTVSTAGYQ